MNIQKMTYILQDDAVVEVIAYMELRLSQAKKSHPQNDYSDQERKVALLREYRHSSLEVMQECRVMTRKYEESVLKRDVLFKLSRENLDELKSARKEIEILKQNTRDL